VFYFDGVSNVQMAGNVLMARFPQSFCFHGGEHVALLFFSLIAKMKLIKVSYSFVLYNFAINGLIFFILSSL
jgi:hypothetical protein